MNRSLRARVAALEDKHCVEPVILHFAEPNMPPMPIDGSSRNFFRLMRALDDDNRPPQLIQGALTQLIFLRRAVRIEGRAAQLFALAQALALGPVDDN